MLFICNEISVVVSAVRCRATAGEGLTTSGRQEAERETRREGWGGGRGGEKRERREGERGWREREGARKTK